ncbi:DNA polymerase eta [Zea mays]|uniref:DNA polymerase eta n=1 Tax=Zea mays TaxID=4577 RepID=A0A1D6NQY8_MAIZE|nr:DNA polymerase eta [Zea mays]AQL00727.1 DNA polymerase eta [Zea mays]
MAHAPHPPPPLHAAINTYSRVAPRIPHPPPLCSPPSTRTACVADPDAVDPDAADPPIHHKCDPWIHARPPRHAFSATPASPCRDMCHMDVALTPTRSPSCSPRRELPVTPAFACRDRRCADATRAQLAHTVPAAATHQSRPQP